MIRFSNQCEIALAIVGFVFILMVNIEAAWNRTVLGFPHIAMKVRPGAASRSVVSIFSQRVLAAIEENEWQWRWLFPQIKFALGEHFVDRLSRNSECRSDSLQAVTFGIQAIHRNRLLIVSRCSHIENYSERLTRCHPLRLA